MRWTSILPLFLSATAFASGCTDNYPRPADCNLFANDFASCQCTHNWIAARALACGEPQPPLIPCIPDSTTSSTSSPSPPTPTPTPIEYGSHPPEDSYDDESTLPPLPALPEYDDEDYSATLPTYTDNYPPQDYRLRKSRRSSFRALQRSAAVASRPAAIACGGSRKITCPGAQKCSVDPRDGKTGFCTGASCFLGGGLATANQLCPAGSGGYRQLCVQKPNNPLKGLGITDVAGICADPGLKCGPKFGGCAKGWTCQKNPNGDGDPCQGQPGCDGLCVHSA